MATEVKKKVTKTVLKKMSVMNLMSEIVNNTCESQVLVSEDSKPYCKELMGRLGLPTLTHASLLSAFINMCDDSNIRYCDLARFYGVRNINMIAEKPTIEWLVKNDFVKQKREGKRDIRFFVTRAIVEALTEGKKPEKKNVENLEPYDFMDEIDSLRDRLDECEICKDEFFSLVYEMMDKNEHITFVKKWKEYCKCKDTLLVYILMSLRFIYHQDDNINSSDLDDFFTRSELRYITKELGDGEHDLMECGLIENCMEDGQANPDEWKLTDKSKFEVYAELNLKVSKRSRNNLIHYETIAEKPLYYNENVTKQVERLEDLMDKDRMCRVLKKMEDKGMRKGFTCLFYGGPGTGKTETVMQIARMTGRDIMLVDVPNIRSKWVGETEKNIKQIFVQYKNAVKNAEENNAAAPILVFNEADAILNKRLEGGTGAVDKMENAMQNIILQEMESLEGIMIATTNLTGSLDAAFERRFLYKIEFEKPTPKERKHIWKAMLKDLTDEQALDLAERFDFSGGQIENIARKRIINDILDERDTLDIQEVIESCKCESLNAKNERKKIGF